MFAVEIVWDWGLWLMILTASLLALVAAKHLP